MGLGVSYMPQKRTGNAKDWALIASALGNVFQAIKQAQTKNDLESTRAALLQANFDIDYLENKLKEWQNKLQEWQKAYSLVKENERMLEEKISYMEKELSQYKGELYTLQKDLQKKAKEKESSK